MSLGTENNHCAARPFGCHISLQWMAVWIDMLACCRISVNVLLGTCQVVWDLNAAGKGRRRFCCSCFLIVQWDIGFLHMDALFQPLCFCNAPTIAACYQNIMIDSCF